MNHYYYHGFEFLEGYVNSSVEKMIKILEEGLRTRNDIREFHDSEFNHICLYKKNDEYDYSQEDAVIHSARGGWIDHCFVVIVDSEIDATKAETGIDTNLVDEWRCYHPIDPSHFVGVALPLTFLEEYLNSESHIEEDKIDKELSKKNLEVLYQKAEILQIPIVDSDQDDFCDIFDSNNKTSTHTLK